MEKSEINRALQPRRGFSGGRLHQYLDANKLISPVDAKCLALVLDGGNQGIEGYDTLCRVAVQAAARYEGVSRGQSK